jgi:hypothetical protein
MVRTLGQSKLFNQTRQGLNNRHRISVLTRCFTTNRMGTMVKLIHITSLIAFLMGSIACSIVDDQSNITASADTANYGLNAATEACPEHSHSEENSLPCNDFCHHHGHCHNYVPTTDTIISRPALASIHSISFDAYYPTPNSRNLFRPPIA